MKISPALTGLVVYSVLLLPAIGQSQSREDDVLNILNMVRTNPQGFLTSHVNAYLEENELTKNSYATSLITDLKKCAAMGELKTSKALNKVAQMHALDMGRRGTVGHASSDGTTFSERLRKKAKAGGMIAENCDYGNEEPLDIVMALLIDDGIKSLGHRKNILEPTFRWIGIAIEKHTTYRINCVMDFAETME